MVYRFAALDSERRVTNYDYIFFTIFLTFFGVVASEGALDAWSGHGGAVWGLSDPRGRAAVTEGTVKTGN